MLHWQRLFPEEVVKAGAMATQGVIWGHESTQNTDINSACDNSAVCGIIKLCNMPSGTTLRKHYWKAHIEMQAKCLLVIYKRVHEEPLLNAFFPLRSFSLEITVGIIGHNHSV